MGCAVDLEVLKRSGSDTEKKHAARIAPVLERQHLLLVTLLLVNAAAMEALPIFIDKVAAPHHRPRTAKSDTALG